MVRFIKNQIFSLSKSHFSKMGLLNFVKIMEGVTEWTGPFRTKGHREPLK